MLLLRDILLDVGGFALQGVSLRIETGQYMVLMGQTGCGKSLTAQIICGLVRPDAGEVLIDGLDMTHTPPWRRGVGYVPQEGALWPHKSVRQNIVLPLKTRRIRDSEIPSLVGPTAELLSLEPLMGRRPATLSGGERQKVALARALVTQPRLLVLDEPVSALDEPTRRDVCTMLHDVHDQLGIATLHICHSTEEARTLADTVAVMDAGAIVQVGSLEDLCTSPQHAAVSRLLPPQA